MEKTVFVVDDNFTNLETATVTLENEYRVLSMTSAKRMFSMLEKVSPDMILLDIEMPEMDGIETLAKLKSIPEYSDIPVIFLTSVNSEDIELKGFELGVVDFIGKPFSAPILRSRIKTHIDIDTLVRARTKELIRKTEEVEKLKNDIVEALADLIENRDKGTGGHIERVKIYTKTLIEAMLIQGVYAEELCTWDLDIVYSSTKMHDIGKLAISDFILNKPSKLTDEEFETMKTHVKEGIRMLDDIEAKTGENEFLRNCRMFAAYHHEKWNGSGYPFGLKGTKIPLQGRIMAVVDVYDALTTERPYKKAFSGEVASSIIQGDSGTHFDPDIVKVFCDIQDTFDDIRVRLADSKPKM